MYDRSWMILLLILLISGTIPLSAEAEPPVRAEGTWTVLVYLCADSSGDTLESNLLGDLNELEKVGSSEDVNIVVQMDRISGGDSSNGDWTDARRILVVKDDDDVLVRSSQLEVLGEVNMADPRVLASFLEWGLQNYPADRYMLAVGGHANGVVEGLIRDSTYTSGKGIMPLEEFGNVLREVTSDTGKRFDVISLDVCWLGMAEAASELMECSDYLVGSFDEIPIAGWPYDRCLPHILDDGITLDIGLERVVESFLGSYDIEGSQSYATLCVVDLAEFRTGFIGAWADLSEELFYTAYPLNDLYDDIPLFIDRARRKSEMVDAYHLADTLVSASGVPERVVEAAKRVLSTQDPVLVGFGSGSYHQQGSRAFGVYHPTAYYDTRYRSLAFSDTTAWDEYVNLLIVGADLRPSRINWTADAPDQVRFSLTSKTPSLVDSVVIEYGDGSTFTNHTMAVSGGSFTLTRPYSGRVMQYRYKARTSGYDIILPPDGFKIVRFESENDPPVLEHWPPSIIDTSISSLSFYLTDETGVNMERTIISYRAKGADLYYRMPLVSEDYERFRGMITAGSSLEWIPSGSEVEYYVTTEDILGNTARYPATGHFITTLGEGVRFYIDGRHSTLSGFDTLRGLMNASLIQGDVGSDPIDMGVLVAYKGYVLLEPAFSFTQSELAELMQFHGSGGEVMVVIDPDSTSQMSIAGPLLESLDVVKGKDWGGGILAVDQNTPLGGGLPTISVPGGTLLSPLKDSSDVYLVPGHGAAAIVSTEDKGRAVVMVSDMVSDTYMERTANRVLAGKVLSFLSTNFGPTVSIVQDPPGTIMPGQVVTFDLSGSEDPDGELMMYTMHIPGLQHWDSPEPVFTHQFEDTGLYSVQFTVEDSEGGTTTTVWSLLVNRAPTPEVGVTSLVVHAGEPVIFDYKGSDPDGDDIVVIWDFGDGSKVGSRTVTHYYSNRGSYDVSMTVTDTNGLSSTWKRTLNVVNSDPVVSLPRGLAMVNSKAPNWTGPQKVTLSVREGDVIFLTSDGTQDRDSQDVLDIYWDMGDGTVVHSRTVEHSYTSPGLFRVVLWADDGHDGLANQSLAVYVENNPPTASFTAERAGGSRIRFDASGSTDDPWDMEGLLYRWDFGDGETRVTDGPVVEHRFGFGGEYDVTLQVLDTDGGSAEFGRRVEAGGISAPIFFGFVALSVLAVIGLIAGIAIYVRKKMLAEDRGLLDLFSKDKMPERRFPDHGSYAPRRERNG